MTRRLLLCALAALLAVSATSFAQAQPTAGATDAAQSAAAAKAAYDAGDLPTALALYRQLLDASPVPSAALHHNLADTYFRLADHPRAILHFLAALRLAPRDPDTAANLALALQTANVPPPPAPGPFLEPIRHLAPAEWTVLAVAFGVLAFLLLLLYLLLPAALAFRPRLLGPVPLLLLLCLAAVAARLTFLMPSYARLALVDAPGAALLSAPLPDATQLAQLPPATTVILADSADLPSPDPTTTSSSTATYAPVLLPPSTHGYLPANLLLPVP